MVKDAKREATLARSSGTNPDFEKDRTYSSKMEFELRYQKHD